MLDLSSLFLLFSLSVSSVLVIFVVVVEGDMRTERTNFNEHFEWRVKFKTGKRWHMVSKISMADG